MQTVFDQPAAGRWRQHESVDSRLTEVTNEVKVLNRCEKSRKQEGLNWLKRDAEKRGWKDISPDKFVINCTLLRVWTPPGSSFKRVEVLPVTSRFGVEDKQLMPPHLVGSTKAKIETFSLLNVSCDIFMNSCCYPLWRPALFWPYLPKLFRVQPQISYSHLLFPNPAPQQQWNPNAKQLCCAVVFRCMALWKC